MRIDRVEAHAFGPFRDESLAFPRPMTVVYGPNEAGKSTWHAAIYGGLCGLRHVGGRPLREDALFEERHRPWGAEDDEWHASVHVTIGKGRTLHFHADLDGRKDYVQDAVTGDNVVSELGLDNEGAPDGARLLGLTRRTILTTIQVRQADVLHVLEAPDGLQEHLQQAAATGGDVTAESALERLDEFHSTHVGSLQWNSKRPRKLAHDDVKRRAAVMKEVRFAHDRHLDRGRKLSAEQADADQLRGRVRVARLARSRRRLDDLQAEYGKAAELSRSLPNRRSISAPEDDHHLEAVADAIASWENRPEEPLTVGPSVADLEDQLAAVPEAPMRETEPAPEVEGASAELEEARRRLAYHDDTEPPPPAPQQPSPPVPPAAAETGWPAKRIGLVGGGAMVAVIGLSMIVAGEGLSGVALLVVGAVLGGVGLLRSAEQQPDAGDIERRIVRRERDTWQQRRAQLTSDLEERTTGLRGTLLARKVDGADDAGASVDALLVRYRTACAERAELAREAAKREDLERQLVSSREAQEAADLARHRRMEATRKVRDAADLVGLGPGDPEALVHGLRSWRKGARAALDRRAKEREGWAQLDTILDGRDLGDLESDVEQQRQVVARLSDAADGAEAVEGGHEERSLDDLEEALQKAEVTVANLEGRLADQAGDLDSLVEAEEDLARAQAVRDGVDALHRTLALTRRFLDDARDRVQQAFAPLLKQAVEERLPRITAGRYRHVRIDPETLDVRVSGDGTTWRHASRLSRGTAEQIYLLLRMAMATHAVTTDEVAPLILDDVTVQSDRDRTRRMLELLKDLSEDRQVIVFTQEPEVLQWAREHLQDEAMITLDPAAIQA